MSLALYGHPFSSYTQKVLIALYENGTPFEFRCIGPDTPQHSAEWLRRWPLSKFPLLVDGERNVVETSIIIEYLDRHYPGAARLIPQDPDQALEVRLWDRIFDLNVMNAFQPIVDDRLRPQERRDPAGVEQARAKLRQAYEVLDRRLAGRTWAAGEGFSLADCAAAPALFYANVAEPFGAHPTLKAYYDRLRARPSVTRAIDEAKPVFHMFPATEAERARLPAH